MGTGPTDGPTAPPERARVGYSLTRELEPALAAKGSTFLVAEWRGRVIGFAPVHAMIVADIFV
jgi:hypothetical protein